MITRVAASNPENTLQGKLANTLYNERSDYTKIFYFGQVIKNQDPKNNNRIKVRIPVIDDIFYLNEKKEDGDNKLPWCVPSSNRFIETPETNTIVIVGLFDPKLPHFGRIYFDSMTDLSVTDIFERLTPEINTANGWQNADDSLEINHPRPVKTNEFEVPSVINYNTGLKGKGNNKLHFFKDTTLLTQNYKDSKTESFLSLAANIKLEASDRLDLHSKQGDKEEYNVVFDKKLFDYLQSINKLFARMVTLLNTTPATAATGPCLPGPNAKSIISEFNALKADFSKFKKTGSSKKIFIN